VFTVFVACFGGKDIRARSVGDQDDINCVSPGIVALDGNAMHWVMVESKLVSILPGPPHQSAQQLYVCARGAPLVLVSLLSEPLLGGGVAEASRPAAGKPPRTNLPMEVGHRIGPGVVTKLDLTARHVGAFFGDPAFELDLVVSSRSAAWRIGIALCSKVTVSPSINGGYEATCDSMVCSLRSTTSGHATVVCGEDVIATVSLAQAFKLKTTLPSTHLPLPQ
jgi:hypothetical protein